jgi:hypothetical protein
LSLQHFYGFLKKREWESMTYTYQRLFLFILVISWGAIPGESAPLQRILQNSRAFWQTGERFVAASSVCVHKLHTSVHRMQHGESFKDRPFADPTLGVAFNHLFAPQGRRHLLMHFLNSILQPGDSEKIEEVRLIRTGRSNSSQTFKALSFETLCTDQKDQKHLIRVERDGGEEQAPEGLLPWLKYRTIQVPVPSLAPHLPGDTAYPTVGITLTRAHIFKEFETPISYHQFTEHNGESVPLKTFHWICVELSKVSQIEDEKANSLQEWLYLLAWAKELKSYPQKASPLVLEAYDALNLSTWDQDGRQAYAFAKKMEKERFWYLKALKGVGYKEGQEQERRNNICALAENLQGSPEGVRILQSVFHLSIEEAQKALTENMGL